MHIFVTGATGLIGTQLVADLIESGHQVTRLVRATPQNENERCWDTAGRRLDPAILDGCEALIHLAGENIAGGRWTHVRKERIYHSRVTTTANLAEAICRMPDPPQVFLVASAIGYYGDAGETILTETSPSGTGFLPKVCRDWESAADPARDRTRIVHIRTGMVLSEKGGALKTMLTPFRMGLGGPVGSGSQYWSWITLRDIARLYHYCLLDESLRGPVNGVSPEPVTNREFTRRLAERIHRIAVIPLPGTLARFVLGRMAKELLLASTRVRPTVALERQFHFLDPDLETALELLPL